MGDLRDLLENDTAEESCVPPIHDFKRDVLAYLGANLPERSTTAPEKPPSLGPL